MDKFISEKTEKIIKEKEVKAKAVKETASIYKPSTAFVGVSWVALLAGVITYNVGLWNATISLSEKGYYFTIMLFGLFSVISVQKSVRDRLEKVKVSDLYYGISWAAALISVLLLVVGLWNVDMSLSEKGFYGMSFTLSLFSAITVQKNVRDNQVVVS